MLGYDVLARRIPKLVSRQVFVEEFSHTILHNQNVFEEHRNRSITTYETAEEEDILMKWANGSFKPKNGLNPSIFDYAMQQYVDHLTASLELKGN